MNSGGAPNARPEADEPRYDEKIFQQKNTFGRGVVRKFFSKKILLADESRCGQEIFQKKNILGSMLIRIFMDSRLHGNDRRVSCVFRSCHSL